MGSALVPEEIRAREATMRLVAEFDGVRSVARRREMLHA